MSKNACGIWGKKYDEVTERQPRLTFPYQVGAQGPGVECYDTVNGGTGYGMMQDVYQNLLYSPLVFNVVADAAKKIISEEDLGADDIPDFLTVYLGGADMVGHVFGIDSIEYEDSIYREDMALGQLIDWIDAKVGRENVLYTLTADHGMDSTPEYEATAPEHLQKFHNQKTFDTGRLMVADIKQATNKAVITTLKELTEKSTLAYENFVLDTVPPTVYLDLNKIHKEICTGATITLQADNGKYLGRVARDVQDIEAAKDESSPYARFIMSTRDDGKITLQADNEKYLGRFDRDGIQNIEAIKVNKSNPTAQFTMNTRDDGKITLQADNGKYLGRFDRDGIQHIEAIKEKTNPRARFVMRKLNLLPRENVYNKFPGASEANAKAFCDPPSSSGDGFRNTQLIDSIYMKHIVNEAVKQLNKNLPKGAEEAYSYTVINDPSKQINEVTSLPGRFDRGGSISTIELVENMYVHGRSGQIYVLPKPHYYYYDAEDYAAMHSTPYWYDRYVQLMYLGGRTKYLPTDLRRVRNLGFDDGSLRVNANKAKDAGFKTQQRNIVATIGLMMGIDYNNMPKAYRDRVGAANKYNSAYRMLTHLYRDDDYVKISFKVDPNRCWFMAVDNSAITTMRGACTSATPYSYWHYDFVNNRLVDKNDQCVRLNASLGSQPSSGPCSSATKIYLVPMGGNSADFILRVAGNNGRYMCINNTDNHILTVGHCNYKSIIRLASGSGPEPASKESGEIKHGPTDFVWTIEEDADMEDQSLRTCVTLKDPVSKKIWVAPSGTIKCNGNDWRLVRGMLQYTHDTKLSGGPFCLDADERVNVDVRLKKCSELRMLENLPGKHTRHIFVTYPTASRPYHIVHRIYRDETGKDTGLENNLSPVWDRDKWVWD